MNSKSSIRKGFKPMFGRKIEKIGRVGRVGRMGKGNKVQFFFNPSCCFGT